MNDIKVTKDLENKKLTVERMFDAPREKVWQAWSDPAELVKWWGPEGWETTIKQFDFKPGGVWHYGMKCVDESQGEWFGQESWGKAIYQEISQPNEFTYQDSFSDAEGNVSEDMPTSTVTVKLSEADGKTKMAIISEFESVEAAEKIVAMGFVEGISSSLDRLEELVTKA